MTCKINADTSDGLKIVSDTSGVIDIQDNGTTRLTIGDTVDLQGTELVLDADADTSITADTDDQIDIKIGGTDRFKFTPDLITIAGTSPVKTLLTSQTIEIGSGRTGDGASFVDLIGDSTYGDYGGRLLRNGGANSATELVHRGTGQLAFVAQDAGLITFKVSNAEKARINADGELFLGTTTNTANTTLVVQGNSGVNSCIGTQTDNTGGNASMYFINPNGIVGSIVTASSQTAFNTSSDYRLKENVDYTWDATTRLKQLKPARFNFITDADTTVDGFLAHEVSSIIPEAITGTKDAEITTENNVINANGFVIDTGIEEADWTAGKADGTYQSDSTWAASATKPVMQSIDQSKLVPLLVKTIQELEARITALESE